MQVLLPGETREGHQDSGYILLHYILSKKKCVYVCIYIFVYMCVYIWIRIYIPGYFCVEMNWISKFHSHVGTVSVKNTSSSGLTLTRKQHQLKHSVPPSSFRKSSDKSAFFVMLWAVSYYGEGSEEIERWSIRTGEKSTDYEKNMFSQTKLKIMKNNEGEGDIYRVLFYPKETKPVLSKLSRKRSN